MTIERITEILGINKAIAYGLIRYLVSSGCIKTSPAPRPDGVRGRPGLLYHIDEESLSKLQNMLMQLIQNKEQYKFDEPVVVEFNIATN